MNNSEFVIDASVALKWLFTGEPFRNRAVKLLKDAKRDDILMLAPPIFDYEVESEIQRRYILKKTTLHVANETVDKFYGINVKIENPPNLVRVARDIARLAGQEKIYDSLYAALAHIHSCELWTADYAFYYAVRQAISGVKYIKDYQ